MIPGASLGLPSPSSKRNKKPIQAARVMPTAVAPWRWRRRAFVAGAEISATDQKKAAAPAVGKLGERDADTLVAAPDPTAAADELIGLDFKRE